MVRVLSLALAALIGSLVGTTVCASAQSYPQQVVHVVVPFSAGSITDGLARILADKLSELWKQQVVVENRPGLPGTTAVAKSAPDGYTLMLTSNGHTIAAAINKNIQFDPVKDFAGVTRVASVPLVAIVPPEFPADTVKEFIARAQENPGKLNFSSAGVAQDLSVALRVRPVNGIELLRRRWRRNRSLSEQLVADVLHPQNFSDIRADFADNLARRSGRRQHAKPRLVLILGQSLGDCRHLRELWNALGRINADRLDLSACAQILGCRYRSKV